MTKLFSILLIIFGLIIIFVSIFFAEAQNTHSIDFEGDPNQAVSLGDDVSFLQPLDSPWTIMAWIRLESYHGADRQMIYFDSETGAGEDSFINMMVRGSNRRFGCDIRDNTGSQGTADSEDGMIDPERWYHVVCQRDGSTMRAFVNGRLAGSGTGAGGNINAGNATILPCIGGVSTASGCATGTAEVFDGRIDEVSFWRRALSEAEIQQRMRQELNAAASTTAVVGLEAYWKFDNSITDSVGRSATILETLVGTPAFHTDSGWKQFIQNEF